MDWRKYRKLPVEVSAIQFTREMAIGIEKRPEAVRRVFCSWSRNTGEVYKHEHFIQTLEGRMQVGIGDYVIKGIQGEFYPCKPDIFEATYEPVED